VVAQYIGLRPVRTVKVAIGLGAATALAAWVSAMLDWLVRFFLLRPQALDALHILEVALLAAASAQIAENQLRARFQYFFPAQGHHLPLIITNTLLLVLSLNPAAGFAATSISALGAGLGFIVLLAAFQALRERYAQANVPKPFRGAALDLISAGLLTIAGSGLVNLW